MKKLRPVPPIYFLFALLAMVALDHFMPGPRYALPALMTVGRLLYWVGGILALAGIFTFKRHGTTILPFHETSRLVTSGVYRLSRNPMYLGLTLLLVGTALILGSATPWPAVPAFVALIDRLFVRAEEAALAAKFPGEYDAYRRRVRRWL